MIIEISSFDHPELDIYARLSEKELYHINEPGSGLFIAESPKVLERALDAGYEPVSLLVEKKELASWPLAGILPRCAQIPVFTSTLEVLKQLTGFPLTRGVLCAMRRKPLPSPGDLIREARLITVLEGITNPTNIGAIFRSAAALGIEAVLLTPDCCDPLYRRSIRVSMGTVFQIPWTFFPGKGTDDPSVWIRSVQREGFATLAMALRDDSVPVGDPVLRRLKRKAVCLGAEGDGLDPRTIASCDYTVRIPMAAGVDSLNVAAASAVAFWELGKIREADRRTDGDVS